MKSFSESQRFTQWWLWVILIGVTLISCSSVYFAWSGSNKQGVPMSLVISCVTVPVLVILLFLLFNLKTTIDETGISYRFYPVHLRQVMISWAEIDKAYIRKYSPIGEYGGWGIRFSLGNGKAYNVSGNMGLQIVFKNGKKLLIGTQKPDEINETLRLLVRNGKISSMYHP